MLDMDKFVKCVSCKTNMLKEFLKPTGSPNRVILDENGENIGHFHCSGAILNKMLSLSREPKITTLKKLIQANYHEN